MKYIKAHNLKITPDIVYYSPSLRRALHSDNLSDTVYISVYYKLQYILPKHTIAINFSNNTELNSSRQKHPKK